MDEIINEDGILCSIISLLPLKEAVRTSVLSRRWRYLWTHIPNLKFDAFLLDAQSVNLLVCSLLGKEEKTDLMMERSGQFVQLVNSVIQQHQGARLDVFFVHYPLTKMHSHHLDEWVRFAAASRTKKIALHLHTDFKEIEIEPYEFPSHFLGFDNFLKELSLSSCSLKSNCQFDGLRNLTKLKLFYLDANEDDINRLLSNCHNLQSLHVWNTPCLVTLTVTRPLNQFRRLTVRDCEHLTEIKMDAMSLRNLSYIGGPASLIFNQSSQLKDAMICCYAEEGEVDLSLYFSKLSNNLPHLQSLVFLVLGHIFKVGNLPEGSSSFIHLTYLEWRWVAEIKMTPLYLATLLDAAPNLEEFKLRFRTRRKMERPPQKLIKLKRSLPEHPHTHLKKIQIQKFYWDKWQVSIALYLLKNATELESMMIEKGPKSFREIHEVEVDNFKQEVPAHIKLLIL